MGSPVASNLMLHCPTFTDKCLTELSSSSTLKVGSTVVGLHSISRVHCLNFLSFWLVCFHFTLFALYLYVCVSICSFLFCFKYWKCDVLLLGCLCYLWSLYSLRAFVLIKSIHPTIFVSSVLLMCSLVHLFLSICCCWVGFLGMFLYFVYHSISSSVTFVQRFHRQCHLHLSNVWFRLTCFFLTYLGVLIIKPGCSITFSVIHSSVMVSLSNTLEIIICESGTRKGGPVSDVSAPFQLAGMEGEWRLIRPKWR